MDMRDGRTDLIEFHQQQRAELDRLLTLPQRDHLAIWRDLPAPEFAELDGEYIAMKTLVDADEFTRTWAHDLMWNPGGERGFFLGKAFLPKTSRTGEGYNRWARVGGQIRRFLRFGTFSGKSLVDGKPAYILRYADFRNPSGDSDLIDELRKYKYGIYLGLATRRLADGSRTAPSMFLIVGPASPWRGVDDESLET